MNNFLVTIKSRGHPYTSPEELHEFYRECISTFTGSEWSDNVSYELPKTRRLHLHTIVQMNKKVFWSRLVKKVSTPRMYIHLQPFPYEDWNTVLQYISKQDTGKCVQDDIININYYSHNYGFE